MICSQLVYVTTYERVRVFLRESAKIDNTRIRSYIAGGCASAVGQTFVVPVDIVAQHLMMYGGKAKNTHAKLTELDPLRINQEQLKGRFGGLKAVLGAIYNKYGLIGFYKGYFASLCTYAPGSAFWWLFYDVYCGTYIFYLVYEFT